MFNDTLIKIFSNSDSDSYVKSIYADFQPFSKSIAFEDGFQIDITSRVFCDMEESITEDSYLEIESQKYKVMEIKEWDDYLEVYLYRAC